MLFIEFSGENIGFIATLLLNRRANCCPAQSGVYRNLRTLVRHRRKLVVMSTEVRNRMHAIVDRLFPGFLDESKSGIVPFTRSSLYLMQNRFSPKQMRRRKRKKLIEILRDNPYQAPPPYEKLLGDLAGAYSRRINIQHRLVYQVLNDEKIVKVLRMWTHYE